MHYTSPEQVLTIYTTIAGIDLSNEMHYRSQKTVPDLGKV